MTPVGFEFEEQMAGTYTRAGRPGDGGEIRFRGRTLARDALRHLREGVAELHGTLDMERFADDVPVAGTIEIRPVSRRTIRYEFDFVANDGRPYRFVGRKDLRLGDLLGSVTTVRAGIFDATGDEIARAILRFDLRADLLPFLISFRRADGR